MFKPEIMFINSESKNAADNSNLEINTCVGANRDLEQRMLVITLPLYSLRM